MTEATIESLTAQLKENYRGAVSAKDGTLTLVRLPEVHFPADCEPASTEALVVFDFLAAVDRGPTPWIRVAAGYCRADTAEVGRHHGTD